MKSRPAALQALGSVHYRRYWFGLLAYAGAVRLVMIAQGWLVFELSRSPLDLGLLGAAMAVPAILLTWTGGALADRVDRRKLLMAACVVTTALLVLQAALDLSGVVTVWQVLTIAVLLGLVGGLEWPAMQALIPSLVAREHLMSAVAMNAIVWQSTRMVIPALGGIAIALWDTGVLFLAAVAGPVSMLAVLCFLDVGGTGTRSRSPPGGAFAEALHFILRHRLFAVLIPLSWAAGFFGSSYLQLMPVFADLLGAGGAGFGALMSASGAGSVLGSLLVGSLSATPRLGRVMLGSLVAAGAGIFVFALIAGFAGLLPNAFHAGLLCVALTNLFISIFMVTSMTALQLRCPDSLRGRVMGLHGVAFNLMILGALFTGALASLLGAPASLAVAALIVVLAAVAALATQPEVRRLDGRAVPGPNPV